LEFNDRDTYTGFLQKNDSHKQTNKKMSNNQDNINPGFINFNPSQRNNLNNSNEFRFKDRDTDDIFYSKQVSL
jgi:hypothetical protein